jgi:hypothetical protein
VKKRIFVTTQFEGFHCWPNAPEEVSFLRDMHRHIFHVRCELSVNHNDRDVEFILFKRELDYKIKQIHKESDTATWSCEKWASTLLTDLNLTMCEVSEDGENGAAIYRD